MISPAVLHQEELSMKDISYITAKLEIIHEDVKQLQAHVDTLRQESAGRKAVTRFVVGALGVLGAVLAWVVQQIAEYM